MSQQIDSKSLPVELSQHSQSQSDPQPSPSSGVFFMGASNFDITGGSFNHANRDVHHTVHNDDSVRSDYNNNFHMAGDSTRYYNGRHNDVGQLDGFRNDDRRFADYNKNHASLRRLGATTYPSGQHATEDNDLRGQPSPLNNQHLSYTGPSTTNRISNHNFQRNQDTNILDAARGQSEYEPPSYENEPTHAYPSGNWQQEQSENLLYESAQIQDHRRDYNDHRDNAPAVDIQALNHSGEAEKPGVVQLRQCIQVYLADLPETEKGNMSGLADALVIEGWDRRSMADSSWEDVKNFSYNGSWMPSVFMPLRKICKGE
ncbi:hypothetical protein EV360DRAFT_85181 [Lentinula raphanica]|nr:hypothetical protein EV360DRAFT_85181 [Lentinula raphanica]